MRTFVVAQILPAAIVLLTWTSGQVAAQDAGSRVLSVSLSLSSPPTQNNTAVLTCTVSAASSLHDVIARVDLSDGLELVDGVLLWEGNLAQDGQAQFSAVVTPVTTGHFTIAGIAQYKAEDHRWVVAEDLIYLSVSQDNASVSHVSPSGRSAAELPDTTQLLSSHIEAVRVADDYLDSILGTDFVASHFEVHGLDERPDIPSLWFVIYNYSSGGYNIDLSVAVDHSGAPTDPSRVVDDISKMIGAPQEVRVSKQEAEAIVQTSGIVGPYSIMFELDWETRRLVWLVQNNSVQEIGETRGYIIDAENGGVIQTLVAGVGEGQPPSEHQPADLPDSVLTDSRCPVVAAGLVLAAGVLVAGLTVIAPSWTRR